MGTPQLSRRDARRIAVRAQLLSADRPETVLDTVRHLGFLQADPTEAVARNADLVLWSRLGSGYDRRELEEAVGTGQLVELDMRLRPAEDVALYRAEMAAWPGPGPLKEWQVRTLGWLEANDACRRDILEKLYDEGPLPASALPDTTAVPWESSGWTNDRNVRRLLDLMAARGEVAAAGREGRVKLWDLAERVYPDVPVVPLPEALAERDRRRLRGLGIARAKSPKMPGEPDHVGEAGVLATVDEVPGSWRVDPAYLDDGTTFRGRTALLSPLDRLVFDRRRIAELFGFDYQLEMYKPAAKRRWGYWAMPVLHGDRLVGKVDAVADRESGVLRVHTVHEDEPFSKALTGSVDRELRDLAGWLDLELERG
ncbi:DNA glycosylase AlkZ-like family protein [Nocardioides campestrisoli]|uniref:DNA glycosylase AlkZ-like family protein n=1 Tax=Nocardioides campestrisoli TaxID=2736757 RepID=UPI00163D50D1|nr:crosslink repair DNA glycosylase YcaQ family protein [Nocardioides campestrisoli]